ncbi:MAG: hypothetical protein QNJ55_18025 [Xenococcus sp. MO_188.B8]|nr:hypothetical protein [Xenococcus sp. MO_188.B8]
MALDWTDFFQFSANDEFDIKEDDNMLENLTGNGKVLSISTDKLVLQFDIPSQTIGLTGFLPNIAGISSVDVPKIAATVSITLFNEGVGNRLEVSGSYIDSSGTTQSFSYTDTALTARLRRRGERLRLDASNSFLGTISNTTDLSPLGRLEFEKTSNPDVNEMDVGKLPFGEKIEIFFER